MTGISLSPKVRRGALVVMDLQNPVSTTIVFQYNPESMTRTLQPQFMESGDSTDFVRLRGAPVETMRLDVEIDATDQLASGDPVAHRLGIHPQLAQLELLLYPKSRLITFNNIQLAAGSLEIIPPAAPLTFLVWGEYRVVPVRITDMSITEEQHDPALNPVRARVGLGLRVLSYNDLPSDGRGYHAFLTHQIAQEALATLRGAGNAANLVPSLNLSL